MRTSSGCISGPPDFAQGTPGAEKYQDVARRITDALEFMEATGVRPGADAALDSVDFYTSHEALLLEYEEALCRLDSTSGQWLAGSGHMIWIGDRTRQPDGAHVEFAKGGHQPGGPEMRPVADKRGPQGAAGES